MNQRNDSDNFVTVKIPSELAELIDQYKKDHEKELKAKGRYSRAGVVKEIVTSFLRQQGIL